MTSRARELAERLEEVDLGPLDVLLMPDFFLDHLLRFRRLADATGALEAAAHGSGNVDLRAERQMLRPGGGATNVAHALARLGVRAHLLAVTSPVGREFLRSTLGRDGVDLSLVRDDGPLATTAAIECHDCSVMIHTPGPRGGLAPESLRDEDWARVASSDAAYVGDWLNPRAHDLAAEVWRVARQAGARTYTDGGPLPQGSRAEVEARLEVFASQDLDALSLNVDELRGYAGEEDPGEAGRALSRRLRARVDLHANDLTASFERGEMTGVAPKFDVPLRQATGAGDTWNAGTILGDLLGLDPDLRLLLANALVGHYVSSERVEPPTHDELAAFLRRAPVREAPARP